MTNREVSLNKLINPHFVGVIVFIVCNYAVFVYAYLIDLKPSWMIPAFLVFHLLFFMLLWSMVKSIIGDPGRVPIYWGFFAEETDNRRRRYCLLCHSFKPERYRFKYSGATIALPANDASSIWTTTVPGSPTAWGSPTGSSSCSSCSILSQHSYFALWSKPYF